MKTWVEGPLNTVVADFEFVPHIQWDQSSSKFYCLPLQLAVANADGEWIIPATAINYSISKRAMLVFISYGQLTLIQKIGKLKTFITWGANTVDFECLRFGLRQVGRVDLLPPAVGYDEQPLAWWRLLRKTLKFPATAMPLNLSRLYWSLFPHDRGLCLGAHDAGVDVIMTIRIIRFYIARCLNLPISGKMENSFPRLEQGIEQLDELEAEVEEEAKDEDVQAEDYDEHWDEEYDEHWDEEYDEDYDEDYDEIDVGMDSMYEDSDAEDSDFGNSDV
jgi:hypothetical protein